MTMYDGDGNPVPLWAEEETEMSSRRPGGGVGGERVARRVLLNRINNDRLLLGLPLDALAQRADMEAAYIKRIFSCYAEPSEDELKRLASVVDVNPAEYLH